MVVAVAGVVGPLLGVSATSTLATTVSTVLLYAGTVAASTYLQMANQPKQDIGTKLSATSGGSVNQSIIAGYKETAGSLIYAYTWGRSGKTPNTYYTRVFCLQDMPSSGVGELIWAGGKKKTIDFSTINFTDVDTDYPADGSGYSGSGQSMGSPVRDLDHDGNHYFWVKILDGSQVAADPYLLAKFGILSDRPWTSSMIGRGRTLMIVTQRFTVKETNSEMSVTAVVQGMRFYDWRKDSTNGGSGSHRWNDKSTHEFSANPFVIGYNIMRGIYFGTKWMYGGQNWPARRFDNDTWTAAANIADENVTLASGETEKRFRMGAEILLSDEPLTVIERILATCSGRLVESGGIIKVYSGGIGAPVYSITDDDIVITEAMTGKMYPSREDICNEIAGTYIEPDNGGQAKAYKKRTNAEYVANDNGLVRPRQMNFDYVRRNTQAQRLAKHALNDNRRFMTKTGGMPSIARKLEPVDVISWTSDRFGFTNKKFIVGDVTLSNIGIVVPILREVDASDADWVVSDEDIFTVGVYGDVVPDTQTIAITVEEFGKKNDDGTAKLPALRILWDATDPDMVDCKRVRVRAWRVADLDEDIDSQKMVDWDEGKAVLDNLVRNALYKVQARIVPYSDRDTDWCDPIEIRTGDYRITDDDTSDDAPNLPTSLSLTTVPTDFDKDGHLDPGLYLTWLAGAVSANHPAAKHFEIQVWRSSTAGGTYSKWFTDTTSDTDIRIAGVNTRKYHKARIRAKGRVGEWSDWSDLTSGAVKPDVKPNDVPTVTGVTATAQSNRNLTKCDEITVDDFRYFKVYRYIGASSSPGAAIYIGKAHDNKYVDRDPALNKGDKCWYYWTAVDSSWNESASKSTGDSCVFRGVIDDDTDNDRPNAPVLTSLTPFIRVAESGENILKVKAVWSAAVGVTDKGSYICFVDDGDSVEKYIADDGDTSVTFRVRSAVHIDVWAKSVKFNGKKSLASNVLSLTPSKKAVNSDDALGLTVSAGFKENVLKWTKATQPDHKWTNVYRRTTSPVGSWALLDTIKGTRFVDKNLSPGTSYDYKIKHADTNDNEGNESSTQSSAATKLVAGDYTAGSIVDGDRDQTAPGAPGTPSLTPVTADIDRDGTLDAGLTVAYTAPGSGRAPKKYLVEVYRSTSIGTSGSLSGYTLWVDFTTHKLSTNFKANARYYHKCVVTPITANDVQGTSSASTSVGVQPAGIASGPPAPTGINVYPGYAGGGAVHVVVTTPAFLNDYAQTLLFIAFSNNITNATPASFGRVLSAYDYDGAGAHFSVANLPPGSTMYLWSKTINQSRLLSASYPGATSGQSFVVPMIEPGAFDAGVIGTTDYGDNSVTYAKLAANVFENGNAAMSVGDVGSTAYLKKTSAGTANPNDVVAGGNLVYSDSSLSSGANPSGNWQCMGRCPTGQATSWLRVS